MKITDRLVGDHKTFRKMLADIEAISNQSPADWDLKKLLRLVGLFKSHLLIHSWFEDRFYYPAIMADLPRFAGGPITASYMRHLDDEHRRIDAHLQALENELTARPPSGLWPQSHALFSLGLQAHMRKEEEELFPASERALGAARLEELSVEMERHRAEAPKVLPHPRP